MALFLIVDNCIDEREGARSAMSFVGWKLLAGKTYYVGHKLNR